MIWLAIPILCLLVFSPLWFTQRRIVLRGRREAALTLYRAQLTELTQEGQRGRIAATEEAQARLEIERRLLATADGAEDRPAGRRSQAWLLPVIALVMAVAAVALYLPGGAPGLPAAPLAPRVAAAEEQMKQDLAMLDMLREKIGTLDPRGEQARQGWVLYGNLEAGMGNIPAASAAWGQALAIRIDPKLAALKAEADKAIAARAPPGAAR